MTKRITFTPTAMEKRFIDKYTRIHSAQKPQEVIHAALKLLERDELIRAHNRAFRRNQAELNSEPSNMEGDHERVHEVREDTETEGWPVRPPLPGSSDEDTE